MPNAITYRSFCWGLGTTSFRTKSFNKTIEQQLDLLDEFWQNPENDRQSWSGNNTIQENYYLFMQAKGFVDGDATRKAKDAREKTSGLVDIGLINGERRITEAGQALLEISHSGNFSINNALQIHADSYIYLKQLLKTSSEELHVRPFVVLLYVLIRVGYLSMDEFIYLLPLCVDGNTTEEIISGILQIRAGDPEASIDRIILNRLMDMDNYQLALRVFLDNSVTEDLICEVGINRKSRQYDKPYFALYQKLYDAFLNRNALAFSEVLNATKRITIGQLWRQYLFDTISAQQISADPYAHLKVTEFTGAHTEGEFRMAFFRVMHLLKAKATLHDYCDLNRRYIRTTDIILFADNQVKLDIVPKHFFESIISDLYPLAYVHEPRLFENCPIEAISPCLAVDEMELIQGINDEFGTHATTREELRQILEDDRYNRLASLIDEKFSDEQLLRLLDDFEARNDSEIRDMVTDDADIPTIFEYVLGILWYKVSERQGKILDYMKLSLDADLLPKTHAAGGEADIVYEYAESDAYPEHSLLIEATLADGANQRRMEMEPVSRHLGRHLLQTRNPHSFCIFVTTYLDLNVLSDFCARRSAYFYDSSNQDNLGEPLWIRGMVIIPIRTNELKSLLQSHMTYAELYPHISIGYFNEEPPHKWYNNFIEDFLK